MSNDPIILDTELTRFQKAKNNATAFVKRNKKIILASAGIAAIAGASAVVRSLTNTEEEDDWFAPAFDDILDGDADILIAVNSETNEANIYAPKETVENTLVNRTGINIQFGNPPTE